MMSAVNQDDLLYKELVVSQRWWRTCREGGADGDEGAAAAGGRPVRQVHRPRHQRHLPRLQVVAENAFAASRRHQPELRHTSLGSDTVRCLSFSACHWNISHPCKAETPPREQQPHELVAHLLQPVHEFCGEVIEIL